ncbi:MAG: hypothetical protein CMP10_10275 [Zetaproteobacteria bacterium]|nr:hypothetical protein [Pseudobdellovibrionaceae bacterium]
MSQLTTNKLSALYKQRELKKGRKLSDRPVEYLFFGYRYEKKALSSSRHRLKANQSEQRGQEHIDNPNSQIKTTKKSKKFNFQERKDLLQRLKSLETQRLLNPNHLPSLPGVDLESNTNQSSLRYFYKNNPEDWDTAYQNLNDEIEERTNSTIFNGIALTNLRHP